MLSNNNFMLLKFYLLSSISIVITSFLVLYPSFNLAFQDEDWRGPAVWETEYVNSRLTSYIPPIWFFDTLYKWIGPNFSTYYILAFIFRNLLAFSILVFLYFITRDRLASFLGGTFMAVSFTGLENTFLVINMIGYIAMTILLIFLITFFKTLDKFSFNYLSVMSILLLLATFILSVRVYPIYAWVFIVDGLTVLMRFKKDTIKHFLIRQFVILSVFLFLYKIGIFSWYSRDVAAGSQTDDFGRFVFDIISLLSNLNLNIVLNFLRGLGNIIFPSTLDNSGIISLIMGVALIIILIGVFAYGIVKKNKDTYLLLSFLIWPVLFYTLYFIIYIQTVHIDSPPLPSEMRYLLPPFIGFNIALAILISLRNKIKFHNIILGSFVLLILIHSIITYSFLNKLSKQRDGFFMMKIWKQIPEIVPQSSLSIQEMNVFYFETDAARALYTINDGFIPHAVAVYKIDTKPAKFDSEEISAFSNLMAPPIISYEELVSYIKKNLSENKEDVWERVFALKVEGEKVIDIKKDVRERVEASLRK